MLQVGALVSGGGRTVINLQEAILRGEVPAKIAVVIAHRENVPAVERCRQHGILVQVIPTNSGRSSEDHIDEILEAHKVQLVCLAGYLRRFKVGEKWAGKTINIHPALLPRHGGKGMFGKHVHQAVLDSKDSHTGCTVHAVDEEYDHGQTLIQRTCEVKAEDDVESLAARVFQEECIALPQAVKAIAEGKITLPSF